MSRLTAIRVDDSVDYKPIKTAIYVTSYLPLIAFVK